jgi:hypothetical protein
MEAPEPQAPCPPGPARSQPATNWRMRRWRMTRWRSTGSSACWSASSAWTTTIRRSRPRRDSCPRVRPRPGSTAGSTETSTRRTTRGHHRVAHPGRTEGSARTENAMQWLLSMRQDDGGWAIPDQNAGLSLNAMLTADETFEPDRGRPASHLITGIVLRALAAHPLPALGRHPPRRRAGHVAVLPPGRLPRPGCAVELAHLLLSLRVDRPAVRARLPRPDRLAGRRP